MLVVIALMAVFVTVAVPSYRRLVADNRIISSLNSLAGSLAESRSEAVTRGLDVIVCPSSNPTSTTPSCVTSGSNWAQGWISFVDADGSNTYTSGDTILRQHGPVGGGVVMGDLSAGTVGTYIVFDRMGFAQGTFSPGTANLTIVACPSSGDTRHARAIILQASGSVQTATDTNGDGTVNGGDGSDVTCP